jgi:nucleotide-binding universal stress UspA family protein
MANEIVVGYDGTEGSGAALRCAVGLAKDLNTQLVLVFGYGLARTSGELQAQLDALRELGESETKAGLEEAAKAGVEVVAEVVDAKAAEALVKVAGDRDARMIVVGSHGERPIAGALLGSVPHRLLHISEKPVVVVRG